MKVLIDSSVWIEFFNPKPSISLKPLESLIQQGQIATCQPIKAEVLSGRMSPRGRRQVQEAFDAMDFIDLNWNSPRTWDYLVEISLRAQREGAPIPGVVDRMILACGLKANLPLWTLDRKLRSLSKALNQVLFQAE